MVSFSYKNFIALMKALPLCPLPQAVNWKNIPFNKPVIYVYNHVTRGAEPFFLGLAAPVSPPIRFLAEITVLGDYLIERTSRDIKNAVFPGTWQRWMEKYRTTHFILKKIVDLLTRYFLTQMSRFNLIPVYLHEPETEEERLIKRRINRQALIDCLSSLGKNIPVAIAPSGGSTHEEAESADVQTIVPTLASLLYKRGKIARIVPCVIKERPPVTKKTYLLYLANRIFLLRWLKRIWYCLMGKPYQRPRVTVEFLPPLTFARADPTKAEKIAFVQKLQCLMFEALGSSYFSD